MTNPIFTSQTTTLINLNDNSKVVYPQRSIEFVNIREYNFDNIYYKNETVDVANGNLVSRLNIGDSAAIEYIDNNNKYVVVSQYKQEPGPVYSGRLAVYQENNKIYESDYSSGRSFQIGKILSIKNNNILFYQYYDYGTTFRIDGYYVLNLDTKQVTLVQCDSTPWVMNDFQSDDGGIISVRPDGIYKVTPK